MTDLSNYQDEMQIKELEELVKSLRAKIQHRDELLKKFIADESVYWDSIVFDGNYHDRCELCYGIREAFIDEQIEHEPDCPLVVAKALLTESKSTP